MPETMALMRAVWSWRMTAVGLLSLADHLPDPVTGQQTTQAERYRILVQQAVRAEQGGFVHLGLGEHHFSHYILPAPLLLLATIAGRTSTIRLSTSVTLLANLDPLRVAEDLAMLDVISGGRAEITFARGVMESTMAAFGIEDIDELRPRFEENLRLVLRLLTEEAVTWEGHYRTQLDEVRLEPRAIQQPHPPVWIGGGLSTISCDLAAELGLPLAMPSLFRYPEDYLPILGRYRDRMAANGFGERAEVALSSYVHVAENGDEARKRWQPYLENYVQFAGDFRGSFGRPLDYEGLLAGSAICGSPAEVVDRVNEVNELLGLARHYFFVDLGGLPEALLYEVVDLLAADVLPQVDPTRH
ncbi:MAG: LLM class flavin-dependent oxidoreductase [Acidimicrobiia bacterium]|nr:LLM class flavin-dependent oxidoreductase [Acidimicrobiia bacterium]